MTTLETAPGSSASPPLERRAPGRRTVTPSAFGPFVVVALTVAWGLWELRPELRTVPYLDDSSLHQQMVRFATARIRAGHLPLTSWFPYLGLGSPHFLHYQSLPAMLTGIAGTAVGADAAFRWSLYLLLALWPLSVYWSARLFGLGRWTAAGAAALAPFLSSAAGIGYETKAYVWVGYGVWTQLWASWTLPLAWGFTFRALRSLRAAFFAVLFIMLTVALHFETGYLAFVPLLVWPWLVPSDLRHRLGRAAVLFAAALAASAWVIVPVLAQSHWAARNQVLAGSGLENGYGAGQMLSWLFTGNLYDAGRWPLVTVLVGVGIVVCLSRWRAFLAGRALLTIWVVALLLSFGRTTFGSLYDIVPGSSDVFIRRFQMGVHLSGLLLAGIGLAWLGHLVLDGAQRLAPADWSVRLARPAGRGLLAGICVVALVVVVAPAWTSMDAYDAHNATNIGLQAQADTQQAPQIDRLLAYVRAHPRGRVYAGAPTNWGNDFLVGAVPVFKYLEAKDVDEVGYTLRTASLMTDPEYWFDDANPGDYPLFGIGYLIVPEGSQPPVAAEKVTCSGPYCLYALPDPGYFHVYDTVGTLAATRADVGTQSLTLLDSPLLGQARDLTVAFNGSPAASPTAPAGTRLRGPPGHVVAEHADLAGGRARAVVRTNRRATVVLSASYDPGWHATVDGRPSPTVMVAPALVGVVVGPGVHTVTFAYAGYGSYTALFVLSLVVLVVLACGPALWRRGRHRRGRGRGRRARAREPRMTRAPARIAGHACFWIGWAIVLGLLVVVLFRLVAWDERAVLRRGEHVRVPHLPARLGGRHRGGGGSQVGARRRLGPRRGRPARVLRARADRGRAAPRRCRPRLHLPALRRQRLSGEPLDGGLRRPDPLGAPRPGHVGGGLAGGPPPARARRRAATAPPRLRDPPG